LALKENESEAGPQPEPDDPSPEPGGECQRCKGTGRIKPDGRIEIDCPDCGGDGVTSIGDLQNTIATLVVRLSEKEQTHIHAEKPLEPKPESPPDESPVLVQPLSQEPATHPLQWKTYLLAGKEESQRTGKWAFVMFSKKDCNPCKDDELGVLSSSEVRTVLDDLVLVKINAPLLTKERLKTWFQGETPECPAYFVVNPEWNKLWRVRRVSDPQQFALNIQTRASSISTRQTVSRFRGARPQLAVYRAVEGELSEADPITGVESPQSDVPETWRERSGSEPVRERIVYVESGSGGSSGGWGSRYASGGSVGGAGGYSSIPVRTYASGSGGSAGGYGGMPVSYYSAPPPITYYSPGPIESTWNSMWTGRSGGWVCGPNGCFWTP
jgi:hypothetical protein